MANLLPPACGKALPRQFLAWALAAVCVASGCGGTVFVATTSGRLLVFVSVTPASADPSQLGGQVQFSARGTFNTTPTVVEPLVGVTWTVDRPAFSTLPDLGRAFITQDGIAQCSQGFIGSVRVFATAAADPTRPVSAVNQTSGSALLVCP